MSRSLAITLVKAIVSIGLLALLFSRVDVSRLWGVARKASLGWLAFALLLYLAMLLASALRWGVLLRAQHVRLPFSFLTQSFLVATFFNNFLPSNIGGDVIRIRDTAGPSRSKTLATTVILVDRGMGLMGLVLISALGATIAAGLHGSASQPIWPAWLWAVFIGGLAISVPAVLAPQGLGRLLQPLTAVHPEWVGGRIDKFTSALGRFREHPAALLGCFSGAILVQGLMVAFYVAVVHALGMSIGPWDLAVIVPLSLVVQMLPISVNGLGLREATFSFYFTRLHLPIESAILLSLVAAALIMVFSLSGAAVYVSRGR